MKLIMFLSVDKTVQLDPQRRAGIPAAATAWVEEMKERGIRREGYVLGAPNDARTLRVRDGRVVIENGSLPGTAITGYNILDCADMEEALEVAAKHPVAEFGVVELRAFGD
jgi:hypothetical protein